jgi:large subunit ribosomal protein L29
MKISELKDKSFADLKKILIDQRVDLFKLRMQKGSQQMVRNHLVVEARKTIARIKTVMTQNKKQGENK